MRSVVTTFRRCIILVRGTSDERAGVEAQIAPSSLFSIVFRNGVRRSVNAQRLIFSPGMQVQYCLFTVMPSGGIYQETNYCNIESKLQSFVKGS
jgi:hypothetical protein